MSIFILKRMGLIIGAYNDIDRIQADHPDVASSDYIVTEIEVDGCVIRDLVASERFGTDGLPTGKIVWVDADDWYAE